MGTRFLRHGGRLAFLLLLALTAATAGAAPLIRSASLRYGMTPAIPPDAFAYFNFTIENPDDQTAEATITLLPEGGGPVYSKVVRVGPRAILEDRLLVSASATENYDVTLESGGTVVGKEKVVTRLETGPRTFLFLINDDFDFAGASDLIRATGLLSPVKMTSVRAAQVPDTWPGFGAALAIVMVTPNFREMSQWQFQAIRDFVNHGGTLLWIKPEGMLAALDTPLRDLLPVTPVRTRLVEDFSFMRAWLPTAAAGAAPVVPAVVPEPAVGTAPEANATATDTEQVSAPAAIPPPGLTAPEGLLFLESVPAGDGVTTLAMGEFPVCRWQRSGLGTVGCIAVDPCQKFFQQNGLFVPIWNHVFSWATHAPLGVAKGGDRAFAGLLELLSGFRIPGVRTVQFIVFGYLGLILVVLFLGFKARWESAAWILVALAGVGLTAGIFVSAQKLAAQQPAQSVTAVTLSAWNDSVLLGEKDLSLLSKGDTRPNLLAGGPYTVFFPWASRSFAGMSAREAWTTPLRSTRKDSMSSLDKLALQALKPRKVCMTFRADTVALGPDLPRILLGEKGPQLQPWVLPKGMQPVQHAFLLVGSGLIRLGQDNGRLTVGAGAGLLQADTAMLAAQQYLTAMSLPSPCLVLISTLDTPRPPFFDIEPGKFSEYEYRFTLVPVVQEVPPGKAVLQPEMICIEPADARARLIFRDGEWQSAHLRGPSEFVLLSAVLPPLSADFKISEVRIDLEATNPGGNVTFDVGLFDLRTQPIAAKGKMTEAPTGVVASSRRSGTTLVFSDLPAASLVDARTGRLGLILNLKQINVLSNPVDIERANRWQINSFRIWVTGEQPGTAARRY